MIDRLYYFFYYRFRAYRAALVKRTLLSCGKNVSISHHAIIEGTESISIDDNVSINAFVHIWGQGKLSIGKNTLIASHVTITTLTHDPKVIPYKNSVVQKEITIGENVWIGSHAVILPGVRIGDNAIIGAGSVVTKNVAPNAIVTGVPATLLRKNEA